MRRIEWWIAGRHLKSRRASRFVSLITFIATAGVTLGVMALVVVVGVMSGLQNDLRDRILIANAHLRILTYGEGLRVDDWRHVMDVARQDPEVVAAAPFVLTQGLITSGHDYAEGAYVIGIEPDTGAASVTGLPSSFLSGDLRFATRAADVDGGVVLGRRLADRLSAFPGAVVTIISPAGSTFSRALGTMVPRTYRFEVTGLFETGMYEYDNAYLVMPREAAQRFAGLDTAVSGVEVRVTNPWRVDRVGERLSSALAFPYRTLDWQQQNHQLFSALKLEKLVLAVILGLIVLVAAFNIVSTLTMSVSDRTKEIGILRAMGMTARQIRRIFAVQGMVVGVVGTVVGLVGGLVVGLALDRWRLIRIDPSVYFIDHLPVDLSLRDLLLIVATSLIIARVATVYPSRRAAALQPVDAIRHE